MNCGSSSTTIFLSKQQENFAPIQQYVEIVISSILR
jgi:hypothetical protein